MGFRAFSITRMMAAQRKGWKFGCSGTNLVGRAIVFNTEVHYKIKGKIYSDISFRRAGHCVAPRR